MMTMKTPLNELLTDISVKQKKGLPYILASCCIWLIIFVIQLMPFDNVIKGIAILSCGALMFPIALFWSKIVKVDLFYKENPLIKAILIATNNQIIYLLICVILLIKAPNLVLPAYAIIYGAHLLPYSFLYQSKSYSFATFFICIGIIIALVFLGLNVIVVPIICEIGVVSLAILLINENKKLKK